MTWILLAVAIAVVVIVMYRPSRTKAPAVFQVSPSSGVSSSQPSYAVVQLFADDVPLKNGSPLSLSIETLGGVSTVLIPRGTELPTTCRETFSTATDNQTSIEVHVLVGDRTLAADNVTVGRFSIVDIPRVLRGRPHLEVELAIDDHGAFRFSAKDLESGRSQPVSSVRSLSNPLTHARVGRMLDDAKAEEAKREQTARFPRGHHQSHWAGMMRVVPSKDTGDSIVGQEYVDEEPEGEFLLVPDGAIIYRHRDAGEMFANSSHATFLESIRAWERYLERVVTVEEETEQLQVVEDLRRDLEAQGALPEVGFWTCILEQAEDGSL